MGLRDVWVELGQGSLVRADAIQKVEAVRYDALRVKVSGERTERWLDLEVKGGCPTDWSEEAAAGFHASLPAERVGRGLIDAIAAGAEVKGGCEVSLRIDLDNHRAQWARRSTSTGEDAPGLSFWDGFPHEDSHRTDTGPIEPLGIFDPRAEAL